jgi:branched-chain amino acid transport system permease protein
VLERTRIGAIIRAGTESIDMVSALGIDIRTVFSLTFATGAALAAIGGALAAPMRGVNPFVGDEVLGLAFVVVALGGMGSFTGALVAALLVGIAQSVTIMVWPLGGNVVIYLLMALVLLLREAGLMGRRTRGS